MQCVFWPAFGCCAHPKAGRYTFLSHFQPFLFTSNIFGEPNHDSVHQRELLCDPFELCSFREQSYWNISLQFAKTIARNSEQRSTQKVVEIHDISGTHIIFFSPSFNHIFMNSKVWPKISGIPSFKSDNSIWVFSSFSAWCLHFNQTPWNLAKVSKASLAWKNLF